MQVSYRTHGSGNSWTSFGKKTYTGGQGSGWVSESSNLYWSLGYQSGSTSNDSSDDAGGVGGEMYRPFVYADVNELWNFPLTVGSASATNKSDRKLPGSNNMRILVIDGDQGGQHDYD